MWVELTDPTASLPTDATLPNGTANFAATLKTTGSRTITATDKGNAAISGSQTVTVQ